MSAARPSSRPAERQKSALVAGESETDAAA
jgi:hypothetical protein